MIDSDVFDKLSNCWGCFHQFVPISFHCFRFVFCSVLSSFPSIGRKGPPFLPAWPSSPLTQTEFFTSLACYDKVLTAIALFLPVVSCMCNVCLLTDVFFFLIYLLQDWRCCVQPPWSDYVGTLVVLGRLFGPSLKICTAFEAGFKFWNYVCNFLICQAF